MFRSRSDLGNLAGYQYKIGNLAKKRFDFQNDYFEIKKSILSGTPVLELEGSSQLVDSRISKTSVIPSSQTFTHKRLSHLVG